MTNLNKKNWIKGAVVGFIFVCALLNLNVSINPNGSKSVLDMITLRSASVQADGESSTKTWILSQCWKNGSWNNYQCTASTAGNCSEAISCQ